MIDLVTCNGKLTDEERRVADEMAATLLQEPSHWKKRVTNKNCFVALKTVDGDIQVVVSRNTIECWYNASASER